MQNNGGCYTGPSILSLAGSSIAVPIDQDDPIGLLWQLVIIVLPSVVARIFKRHELGLVRPKPFDKSPSGHFPNGISVDQRPAGKYFSAKVSSLGHLKSKHGKIFKVAKLSQAAADSCDAEVRVAASSGQAHSLSVLISWVIRAKVSQSSSSSESPFYFRLTDCLRNTWLIDP